MIRPSWDQRIQRAEELGKSYSFAAEVLSFYARLAAFQKELCAQLESTCAARLDLGLEESLRDQLDLSVLLPRVPALLTLMEQIGPPPVVELAHQLVRQGQERWEKLLMDCWERDSASSASNPERLFALACLQPYAEYLASHTRVAADRHDRPTCPVCDGAPVVGVLRPEALGVRRSLVCSLCSTEWDYRRVVCPACGEDRFEQLPVYTAPQFEHVRVEACDSCKTYIKTVDLTKNGLAVPVVDELATIPLNLWAQEKGYTKLQPNLLGM